MATYVAKQETTSGGTIGGYMKGSAQDPAMQGQNTGGNQSTGGSTSASSGSGIDYTFYVGKESIPEYNARIAAARGSSPSGSTTPYVSDSSSIVSGENDTINQLNTYFGQTPDIKNLIANSQGSIAEIDKYASELRAQYDADVMGIKSNYESARKDTKTAYERERGTTNTTITTRLGGYLGSSGSAVGVMNNMAKEHRAQLLKLDAQRDAALQAARNAVTAKQFELARMKAEEIKSLSSEIYQRQQDFFNNALKLSQERRVKNADTLEKLKEIGAGSDDMMIDPNMEREIDSYYGVQGFTQSYLAAARSAAAAKSQQEKYDTMQKYVNLIESIPNGMSIPFGDEVVTGIGSAGDIATYQIEDAAGNVRIVAYDKRSGGYSMTNMGKIGTPSGGGSASQADKDAALSATMQALSSGKDGNGNPVMDPATGEISASAYIQAREAAEGQYPGTAQYIDSKFLASDLSWRYFDDEDLNYLRQKLGVGVGYGAIPSE